MAKQALNHYHHRSARLVTNWVSHELAMCAIRRSVQLCSGFMNACCVVMTTRMAAGKTGRTTTQPTWQPGGCSKGGLLGVAEAIASSEPESTL